jgi:hypothetical protein
MDDYLLGNIKTLHLAHRRQGCAQSFHIDAGPDELDFNQMPRLDTLIVNDAVIKDESKWTAARELERWIVSRRNQGMPFRSVEFRACEKKPQADLRLAEGQTDCQLCHVESRLCGQYRCLAVLMRVLVAAPPCKVMRTCSFHAHEDVSMSYGKIGDRETSRLARNRVECG